MSEERMGKLYETDFYGWAMQQTALLRQGRFDAADIDNIAEEIESLGRREKRELRRRREELLSHLLRWRVQPGGHGNAWRATIEEQRLQIHDHSAENLSLRPTLPETLAAAWRHALFVAKLETGFGAAAFPAALPWTSSRSSTTASTRRATEEKRRRSNRFPRLGHSRVDPMTGRPPKFYYTFAVKLTETVKIMAPSQEEARARGVIYAPARNLDFDAEPRILKQSIEQGEIELLSTEDPMEAIRAEARERDGDMPDALEVGKALEARWQRLEARVAALEAKANGQ